MHKLKVLTISIILVISLSLASLLFNVSARPLTAIAPPLGAAGSFSVLAGLSMSAAGAGTTVQHDLGLSPGLAISRTGPWTVGGTEYFGPLSLAGTAQTAALGAFGNLAGQVSNGPWSASPWSPVPGVWTAASDTTFAGTITLSGDYSDVWVFQVGRDMTFTGSVIMAGNAQPCNVFWVIGRDATIAVGSTFVGTLIASRDVTLVSGATVNGRIISLTSSLTTDGNTISGPTCLVATASPTASPTLPPATQTAIAATLAPTQTAIVATQTAIAATIAPTLTAIAATQTAIAATSTPTNTPTRTPLPPVPTNTPIPAVLPGTGFAQQRVTVLSAQPAQKAYADLGALWLEIPRLGVQMPIVGVPQTAGKWDVSWLGAQAGWLNGTAFPTWAGNSVMTGHVYDANGNPGPFVHLNWMWWGDKVIVHAWGAQYVYEVRQVMQVGPGATSSVIKHEELPWVTLITCRGYDEASNSYKYRVVVRAVLVEVK